MNTQSVLNIVQAPVCTSHLNVVIFKVVSVSAVVILRPNFGPADVTTVDVQNAKI